MTRAGLSYARDAAWRKAGDHAAEASPWPYGGPGCVGRGVSGLRGHRLSGQWPTGAQSKWRRGWDSNPRWTCAHASFQDWCLKPLGHPSTFEKLGTRLARGPDPEGKLFALLAVRPRASPDFKTAALNHSATLPNKPNGEARGFAQTRPHANRCDAAPASRTHCPRISLI
jgi:hypothetical protein